MFADGMCDKCMHEKAVCFHVPGVEGETGFLDVCMDCYNQMQSYTMHKIIQEEDERRRAISNLPHPRQCLYLGWYKTCKDEICAMNMKVMARKCGFFEGDKQ